MAAAPPPGSPSEPAIDPDIFAGLLELTDDDDDSFVIDLFESYVGSHAQCASGMRRALSEGDADAFRRHAHTLKGASANVGAWYVAELAKELQARGESGDLDGVSAWIDAIDVEFERVMGALRQHLPSFALPA